MLFKCRYVRLPLGYALSSLSWGTGSCFFVVSAQHIVAGSRRSGVLIYRFKHWHSGWHTDKLRAPHFLLHTGLRMPIDRPAPDDDWNDRFVVCPENYPLSSGLLLPPLPQRYAGEPLVAVQVQLDPSSCRLFVVFAEQEQKTHVAA